MIIFPHPKALVKTICAAVPLDTTKQYLHLKIFSSFSKGLEITLGNFVCF